MLNDRIVQNPNIKGITVNGEEIKSIQFADDLNIPTLFNQDSLNAIIDELKLFKSQVGLRINLEKSLMLRIGPIKDSTVLLNSQGIPWTNDTVRVLGVDIVQDCHMEKKNMEPLLSKMKIVCDSWKAHDLSLVGKVLVINSLVMSLLVYRLAVIPSLSAITIKKINKIWSEFIWGKGKRPKIAWKILTAQKSNGGLGLSDIAIRDQSLKIQWVQRYCQDSVIRALADASLQNNIGTLLWRANLKSRDVNKIFKFGHFWLDVLFSWAKFNYQCACNRDVLLEQMLWFNSDLRKNNLPFISNSLYNSGIVYIRDIVNADFSFKLIQQILSQFPGADILEYISLIQLVPSEWKRWIRLDSNHSCGPPVFDLIDKVKSLVSISYKSLNNDPYVILDKIQRWQTKLQIALYHKDFVRMCKRIWCITNYSKLRSFQFRLLMNALVTNVVLFKWKIQNVTPYCTFCSDFLETDIHLLCDCQYVKEI